MTSPSSLVRTQMDHQVSSVRLNKNVVSQKRPQVQAGRVKQGNTTRQRVRAGNVTGKASDQVTTSDQKQLPTRAAPTSKPGRAGAATTPVRSPPDWRNSPCALCLPSSSHLENKTVTMIHQKDEQMRQQLETVKRMAEKCAAEVKRCQHAERALADKEQALADKEQALAIVRKKLERTEKERDAARKERDEGIQLKEVADEKARNVGPRLRQQEQEIQEQGRKLAQRDSTIKQLQEKLDDASHRLGVQKRMREKDAKDCAAAKVEKEKERRSSQLKLAEANEVTKMHVERVEKEQAERDAKHEAQLKVEKDRAAFFARKNVEMQSQYRELGVTCSSLETANEGLKEQCNETHIRMVSAVALRMCRVPVPGGRNATAEEVSELVCQMPLPFPDKKYEGLEHSLPKSPFYGTPCDIVCSTPSGPDLRRSHSAPLPATAVRREHAPVDRHRLNDRDRHVPASGQAGDDAEPDAGTPSADDFANDHDSRDDDVSMGGCQEGDARGPLTEEGVVV